MKPNILSKTATLTAVLATLGGCSVSQHTQEYAETMVLAMASTAQSYGLVKSINDHIFESLDYGWEQVDHDEYSLEQYIDVEQVDKDLKEAFGDCISITSETEYSLSVQFTSCQDVAGYSTIDGTLIFQTYYESDYGFVGNYYVVSYDPMEDAPLYIYSYTHVTSDNLSLNDTESSIKGGCNNTACNIMGDVPGADIGMVSAWRLPKATLSSTTRPSAHVESGQEFDLTVDSSSAFLGTIITDFYFELEDPCPSGTLLTDEYQLAFERGKVIVVAGIEDDGESFSLSWCGE